MNSQTPSKQRLEKPNSLSFGQIPMRFFLLLSLAESVEGFGDLEDDDHDGDDEEYRFSCDWDDCVDEIDR